MRRRPHSLLWFRTSVYCVALLFLAATFPAPARAAVLRGRLERVDQYGRHFPAAGISVTVYRQDMGRSSPSVTDATGMYYLNVPAGGYWLEIWVSNPPRAYQILVVEPVTDIPPIVV
jgi:hypothetical protein